MQVAGRQLTPGPRRIRSYFTRYRGKFAFGILFLILTQAFALTVPQLLRIATDGVVNKNGDDVWMAALGLAGVALGGGLVRVLSRILIFTSGRRVEYDIRNDVFRHLEGLPPSFYHHMPVGQVMSRMVNDLTQVRLLLGPGLLNLTNTTLVYIVVIPILFYSDWKLTLLALLPLPFLLMLGRVFAKRIYTLSREAQEKLARLSSRVQENLSGVMTVRVFRQEQREQETFHLLNTDYLDTNMKLARLRGLMFPAMGLAGAAGTVIVLWVGGQRIVSGAMTVGEYVEFASYLAALTWPTIALGWMISLWQRGVAAMERVNQIFETEPAIADGGQDAPSDMTLELRNLSFTYPGAEAPSLSNISFTIKPGERIVVVGKTGSGKSTLLELLARLLEAPKGSLFQGGVDVTDLPLSAVRDRMGFAPQDAFLFSRSTAENVAFGKPGSNLGDVRDAIRLAHLDDEIEHFTQGYHTVVGERGITLSGGQRQRATLARAFLPKPELLILDDALSAVDTETETEILSSLGEEGAVRTVVMATHRLASAATADRILVLDQGQLVEQGTEAELLALGGIYTEMHRRQRLREAIEAEPA